MGKKSKSSSVSKYRAREAAPEKAFDPKASKHRRLETEDDAWAEDGEDAFHRNRDTVLFEDGGRGGRGGDLDEVSDPDEIYGLNLPSGGSESDDDEAVQDDEAEDGEEEDDMYDSNGNLKSALKAASDEPRGRFAKSANPDQDIISNGSDSDAAESDAVASDDDAAAAGSDSDDEETWAPGSYHASRRAPGEADSEDDEALELEANEARRLQQLAKGKLGGEDYGFDAEGEAEGTAEEVRKAARDKVRLEEDEAGERVAGGKMTEEEAIAHLVRNSPETLALLDDFAATAQRMESVERDLDVVRKGGDDGKEHPALAIMELEYQALSTYLPTLAFYFSLLLQPAPPAPLVTKVVHRLSAIRKALATMEELDLTSAPIDDYEHESGSECGSDCEEDHNHGHGDESDEDDEDDESLTASELWDLNAEGGLNEDDDADMLARVDGESDSESGSEDDELEDDEEMMDEDGYDSEAEAEMEENLMQMTHEELELLKADMAGDEDAEMLISTVNRVQRRKAGLPSEDEQSDEDSTPPPVSTKKPNKRQPAPAIIPTLAPLASSSKSAKRPAFSGANDDFVDPQNLSRTDASDKANKKHTLRFHVSQVNQRQHKRENANAARVGGDDDLPRRSKERSRREVLKRQEHGGQAGEALDGADWDDEDRRVADVVKGKAAAAAEAGGDDDGDYYDLVKMSKEEGRAAKKAKYEDERLAERDEIMALASGEAGVGPRAANKMILKNKGLTPRRKKENRNSRVKKRLQYDKAQKKVASMKPTYKGPGAGANYSGETSGISARNVRAINLAK